MTAWEDRECERFGDIRLIGIPVLVSFSHMSTFGQPRQKFAGTGEFGTFESIIMDPSILAKKDQYQVLLGLYLTHR